jgi:tRNA-specific adenosine deaminase 1
MRCLPSTKISLAQGRCLHDWHAEIVALRALNHYLLQECDTLASDPASSSYFVRRAGRTSACSASSQHSQHPFAIQDDVKIYMYCSEAPCGDASMELIMAAQDDATPWEKPVDTDSNGLTGRGYFSELGVVRRKPARGDAPQTLSKSCTDKLSMKQCTSVLSCLPSLLINPGNAYIDALVLPSSQHVSAATDRAFGPGGRMSSLMSSGAAEHWNDGYAFKPFQVIETSLEFEHSRRAYPASTKTTGSNITAMWTPRHQEVLIGGSIQGNKQFSVRGSSAVSKLGMWKKALALSQKAQLDEVESVLASVTYADLKASKLLEARRRVKEDVYRGALQNWVRNDQGNDFSLDEQ